MPKNPPTWVYPPRTFNFIAPRTPKIATPPGGNNKIPPPPEKPAPMCG